jgi:septum formation protein
MTISRLILASTSPYRKQLLDQLGVQFEHQAPNVAEVPLPGEAPKALAERLGLEKAQSVAQSLVPGDPDWIVVGSDQVCHLDGRCFGKPGNFEAACQQLQAFSGKWVSFTTSLALVGPAGPPYVGSDTYQIQFKLLTDQEIAAYLALDEPYDCAGAIKVEQNGRDLLQDERGTDINTLYGLPVRLLEGALLNLGLHLNDFK